MHTNTTPERYIFIYYYSPMTCFGHSIQPSSGRGYKYINGKVYYRSGPLYLMMVEWNV
jgi:hypothetical protein